MYLNSTLTSIGFFIFLIILLFYSNYFHIFCEDFISQQNSNNLKEYYITAKSFEDNYSKFCFIECLSCLNIYYEIFDTTEEPILLKEVLDIFWEDRLTNFCNYLMNDPRTSKDMKIFLNFFKNRNLQIKNNEEFKYFYKIFLDDYSKIFEKEWHPKGFYTELNAFKNKISIFEILPLLLSETRKEFYKTIYNLNFFDVVKNAEIGYYLVYYTDDYGEYLLEILSKFFETSEFKEFIESSSFYSEETNKHFYKLKHAVGLINSILWYLEDLKNTNSNIEDHDRFAVELMFAELAIEKKSIQKLIYYIYYPRVVNGDLYFLKLLQQCRNSIYEGNEFCAFANVEIDNYREYRTFKRYVNFLLQSGIIESRAEAMEFLDNFAVFRIIISNNNDKENYRCVKKEEILRVIDFFETFIKKIKAKDDELAFKYLSKDVVLSIREKKELLI